MKMQWFRLWNDLIHNEKVMSLSPKMFRAYIMTLCIASANEQRGAIPPVKKYAFLMRFSEKKAHEVLAELQQNDLIYSEGDSYFAIYLFEDQCLRPSPEVWKIIRSRIFERDDFTCQYCGARGARLECDHVIPVSRGGDSEDDNLVTACFSCNRSKRDKLVSEWMGVTEASETILERQP